MPWPIPHPRKSVYDCTPNNRPTRPPRCSRRSRAFPSSGARSRMRPAGPCVAGRRGRLRDGVRATRLRRCEPGRPDCRIGETPPAAVAACRSNCQRVPRNSNRCLGGDANRDQAERPTGIDRRAADGLARSIATLLDELLTVQTVPCGSARPNWPPIPTVRSRPETLARAQAREGTANWPLGWRPCCAGAEAVGCQSAALYLLDDDTSELKMRSCWGLPCDRLAAPARPLRGAVGGPRSPVGSCRGPAPPAC